jgi:hypothetical protein
MGRIGQTIDGTVAAIADDEGNARLCHGALRHQTGQKQCDHKPQTKVNTMPQRNQQTQSPPLLIDLA